MKTPPEPVTGFQLSHLQLSSLLWRFALGGREKELFWMETGRKIIPGAAHPLPRKPKNGDVHRNPFSSWKSGWFIPNRRLGEFVPAVSPFPGFELWWLAPPRGRCPSGGTSVVPGVPSAGLDSEHEIPAFFLHGILASAPKSRIFWVPQKPQGLLWQSLWSRAVSVSSHSRLCHPSKWQWEWRFGSSQTAFCSRSWKCFPRGAALGYPVGCGTRSLQDVPAVFNPSSLPVLIPAGIFRPV